MLRYLSDYKRESVLAPLFKMLEATFDLFVPLVMADIVNVGIAAHDFHYILVRCGILLLLAIVGLACSLTAQYFSAKAAVGYSTGLRHALFEHIQTLSFSEMDTMGTSTLITRMTSDVNQVQSGLNLFLRLFLRSPFVVFGAMIMAFTVNFRAALIFVVAIPLLSVVVFGVMVITRPLYYAHHHPDVPPRAGAAGQRDRNDPRKPDGRARRPRLRQGKERGGPLRGRQ